MADDIAERVAKLEQRFEGVPSCAQLVRVEERAEAAKDVADKFISLRTYHNDILERRVSDLEKTCVAINVKLALIGIVGIASFGGVITMLIRMFETAVK